MLEDGQYTDLDGNLVDLDGYIVIFTANLSNSNFKEKIPEPLFSRFDMTIEFQPLSKQEIFDFVADFIEDLIDGYEKNIGELQREKVKSDLLEKGFTTKDNLRNIKRDVMNSFVNYVGLDRVWYSKTEEETIV